MDSHGSFHDEIFPFLSFQGMVITRAKVRYEGMGKVMGSKCMMWKTQRINIIKHVLCRNCPRNQPLPLFM